MKSLFMLNFYVNYQISSFPLRSRALKYIYPHACSGNQVNYEILNIKKHNITLNKCEIADIGVLKGVQIALCCMECVNLKTNTFKILGIYFSYNGNLKNDDSIRKYIIKIERFFKFWRMRQLTIEGKIVIFKTLAKSKVVHIALVKNGPSSAIA